MKATCRARDCDTTAYSRELCRFHYDRQRKTGSTEDPPPRPRRWGPVCRGHACAAPARTQGYCGAHYERIRAHRDPLDAVPIRRIRSHSEASVSGVRECSKCGVVKALGEFGKDGLRLRSDCRSCATERVMADYVPRARPGRDYGAPYTCRHCGLTKAAVEYSLRFKGQAERNTVCRSCSSLAARAYRKVHRKRLNAHSRRYYLKHPEAGRQANWIRKARMLGAPQPVDRQLMREYESVIRADPCVYCGGRSQSVDHIVPIARRGSLDWHNLAPACQTCNSSKGASPLLVFLLRRLT